MVLIVDASVCLKIGTLKECLIPAKRFVVRLVVFNIVVPIMKGTKAELFAHSLCEPCTVVRLRSALSKASGEVLKQKPRFACLYQICIFRIFSVTFLNGE